MKPKLGLDCDGVLCDLMPHMLLYIFRHSGITMTQSDIYRWDIPVGTRTLGSVIREALSSREFLMSLPTMEGAKDGVDALAPYYDITIITSRSEEKRENTKEWVRKNIGDYPVIHTGEAEKHLHDLDILIDDAPHNIEAFLSNGGKTAIIYDHPWNLYFNPISRRFRRVWNWSDILNILLV